jgi:hypothetical protein
MPQISKFAVLAVAASFFLGACHKDHSVYALTNNGELVQFDTASPGTINSSVSVPAIATLSNSSEGVVQIAYNPVDTRIYCITGDGYLCVLDPGTGTATLVGTTPFTEILGNGGNSVTLSNPVMSFDPVNKVFRVISSSYNLLVSPSDGTLLNSTPKLAYVGSDTNNGQTPSVAGIAYQNPVSNASSTTLYALDSTTHSLARIGDDNVSSADTPNTGDMHTIGSAGLTFDVDGGLAIDPSSGDAYAILLPSGSNSALYSVDLDSGALTSEGAIGTLDNDSTSLTFVSLVIVP